ncbi:WYL domain-containing protein [Fulvivirgaceae bacterium BMA12]|uniref:WYL domain-containing protein n=1 Tax=Agaribacillus aureus TaxID=3051825 RepID=A0ABT8LCI6_9BACT|nr:WYL domain-containing protein [Fulvivirgaceae bacterium BMA12]
MEKDKPRLARLTAIMTQLQSKRIVTAREIAERHDISIRTVYRDIRTLEKSGVPIINEEGKGYSVMEGFRIPPVMFTEEEANALITAEQIINKNKDRSFSDLYQSAITKIKSVLRYSQKEKTSLLAERIQIRSNKENKKTSDYLIQLQSAIVNFQVVRIQYLSLENQHSKRDIEPFAMYSAHENWILIAFCRLRNELRAFRLDCIQELQVTSHRFTPHDMTLQDYFEQCRKNSQTTPDIPMAQ